MSSTTLKNDNGRLMISGDLDFSSVRKLWEQSLGFLNSVDTIDFSNVNSSNSAGIALILEWQRWAQINKHKLIFISVPKELQSISKLCGLELFK